MEHKRHLWSNLVIRIGCCLSNIKKILKRAFGGEFFPINMLYVKECLQKYMSLK